MSSSIEYLLFDLDNTLYSSRWGLEQEVSRRANHYVAEYLDIPLEEAIALRKERVIKGGYGTTLEWLCAEHGLGGTELERYFAYIHPENEADTLLPDPALRAFLISFSSGNIPMGILTNSPLEHAKRILTKLGVEDLFHTIFDIRRNGYKGKPKADVYRRVLKELDVTAPSCLLIDDVPRYVEGYLAIGGTGVLFDEDKRYPEFPGPRIQKLEEISGFLEISTPDL